MATKCNECNEIPDGTRCPGAAGAELRCGIRCSEVLPTAARVGDAAGAIAAPAAVSRLSLLRTGRSQLEPALPSSSDEALTQKTTWHPPFNAAGALFQLSIVEIGRRQLHSTGYNQLEEYVSRVRAKQPLGALPSRTNRERITEPFHPRICVRIS